MSDRNSANSRTTLSLRERKPNVRNPPSLSTAFPRFRPLTFPSAGNSDLDVQHVLVFPEGNRVVRS
jgi:hypothetical protein